MGCRDEAGRVDRHPDDGGAARARAAPAPATGRSQLADLQRFSPRRSHWPEVDTYDERARELERRTRALKRRDCRAPGGASRRRRGRPPGAHRVAALGREEASARADRARDRARDRRAEGGPRCSGRSARPGIRRQGEVRREEPPPPRPRGRPGDGKSAGALPPSARGCRAGAHGPHRVSLGVALGRALPRRAREPDARRRRPRDEPPKAGRGCPRYHDSPRRRWRLSCPPKRRGDLGEGDDARPGARARRCRPAPERGRLDRDARVEEEMRKERCEARERYKRTWGRYPD